MIPVDTQAKERFLQDLDNFFSKTKFLPEFPIDRTDIFFNKNVDPYLLEAEYDFYETTARLEVDQIKANVVETLASSLKLSCSWKLEMKNKYLYLILFIGKNLRNSIYLLQLLIFYKKLS